MPSADPGPPPSGGIFLLNSNQYAWLAKALEYVMDQNANLTAEVATLKSKVAQLAADVSSEISDLAAAIAAEGQPSQAVADAITSLQDVNGKLSDLSASLGADNAPAA